MYHPGRQMSILHTPTDHTLWIMSVYTPGIELEDLDGDG